MAGPELSFIWKVSLLEGNIGCQILSQSEYSGEWAPAPPPPPPPLLGLCPDKVLISCQYSFQSHHHNTFYTLDMITHVHTYTVLLEQQFKMSVYMIVWAIRRGGGRVN